MSKIEVNTVEPQCGTTLTLGGCGQTVALGSGASQTGFGRTGTVDWQTGSIKTSTFTAANGEGYFANTTGGAFTMNLPAGSAGNIVSVQDYNNTFDTHALTVTPNGSEKINGGVGNLALIAEGQGLTLVYIDSTVGWRSVQENEFASAASDTLVATGGTVTTCGNFKIHTFTGPGTFCVSSISVTAAENTVGYMVVAGGGGGGIVRAAGGGAGGFREGRNVPIDNFTASPLVANAPTNAVTVTAQAYPITVGAGGGAGAGSACTAPAFVAATNGSNPIFSTITSTGGGKGGSNSPPSSPSDELDGGAGGSGGGTLTSGTLGTGNSPPVTPNQGTPGGDGAAAPKYGAGGGGGATALGANGSTSAGGNGGVGATTSITGSPVARAGGGGGGTYDSGTPGSGPSGGGSGGPTPNTARNGTDNTGGGGGGSDYGSIGANTVAGTGGSGIVVIRYKFQ